MDLYMTDNQVGI